MSGDHAWVLAEEPHHGLGAAMAWAIRHDITSLDVVAEGAERVGVMSRRAALFDADIRVWGLDGRDLRVGAAARRSAEPQPLPAHLAFIADIEAAGATPCVEYGVVAGEVFGLEVCRVLTDPTSGEDRLEVGIGAHDRETFQLLHGDRPTVEALADVVASVAEVRTPGSPSHPLNRLAAERLLRARIVSDPSLIGATVAVTAPPPVRRQNVKDAMPCVAIAEIGERPCTVVCSTGVDLEAVPFAADAADMLGLSSVRVAVPATDAIDIQQRLVALLRVPAAIVPVSPAVA